MEDLDFECRVCGGNQLKSTRGVFECGDCSVIFSDPFRFSKKAKKPPATIKQESPKEETTMAATTPLQIDGINAPSEPTLGTANMQPNLKKFLDKQAKEQEQQQQEAAKTQQTQSDPEYKVPEHIGWESEGFMEFLESKYGPKENVDEALMNVLYEFWISSKQYAVKQFTNQ